MTQHQEIIDYMNKYKYISSLEATRFLFITQFHRCMTDLINMGYKFNDEWMTFADGRKNYKRYWLNDEVVF